MLNRALKKCIDLGLERITIDCRDENKISVKVIENNYCIYEYIKLSFL